MVRRLKRELVYVALTGHHFVTLLASYLESGERTVPFNLRLLLLSPEDRSAWEFVYRLRDGTTPSPEDREQLLAEDRALQQKALWLLKRLKSRARHSRATSGIIPACRCRGHSGWTGSGSS